nr:phosphonopyruvate decarboxylase [Bittarella massiliensis (ex Durand et al. 2017)]
MLAAIEAMGIRFFTGVPDSQLRPFCDALMARKGICQDHQIAPNEGVCTALAAGEYLSSGRPACVYLQNSGLGNIANPVCSLTHPKVYAIPTLFVVGWRGEPGVKDEPQHLYQGEITLEFLQLLGIKALVLTPEQEERPFLDSLSHLCKAAFPRGESVAVVVKKGALTADCPQRYQNKYPLKREAAIRTIVEHCCAKDFLISSTGKISRELFEVREALGQGHGHDFLTVGSMGHCSAIALRVAQNRPQRRVFCIDGDGALLMHMGTAALIGSVRPANLIHILLDNGAHETVGGLPTVSGNCDFCRVAKGCGYPLTMEVHSAAELAAALDKQADEPPNGPVFLRVFCALGARDDLGRPTRTPLQNRDDFMREWEQEH